MEEAWKLTERQKKEGRRYVEEGAERKRDSGGGWEASERGTKTSERKRRKKRQNQVVCAT